MKLIWNINIKTNDSINIRPVYQEMYYWDKSQQKI